MQIKELIAESLALKPGNIIDLSRNYPQYSRLLGRVENITPAGKYQILIVKADSTAKNPPYREGQTITIASNYIRRCPIVAESLEEAQRLDPSCWKGYRKQGTKLKGGVRVNNCVKVKESIEYTLYVDNKPVTKYIHSAEVEQTLDHLKSKYPNKDFRIVQTVCKDIPYKD